MADAAREAVGIDLILEEIMKLTKFDKLKELRFVNKAWNQIACNVIRKRCEMIELVGQHRWAEYERFDSTLANRDIAIDAPIDATVSLEKGDGHLKDFVIAEFITSVHWRSKIERLEIQFVSIDDTNRILPFLLKQLESMKTLCVKLNDGKNVVEDFVVPALAPDDVFASLMHVEFNYYFNEIFENTLDATFLRHCPKLTDLDFKDEFHDEDVGAAYLFLGFFRSWKLMAQEVAMPLHRIQHLHFDFENRAGVTEALVEFINFNQPTVLSLSGSLNYDFPNLFAKIQRWTPAINTLTISVPQDDRTEEFCADLVLRLLKKFEIFAHLSEIFLWIPEQESEADSTKNFLNERQVQGPDKHKLAQVEKLVVKPGVESNDQMLEKAAMHVSNVTWLELEFGSLRNDEEGSADYMDDFFNACKSFLGLRRMSMCFHNFHDMTCYDLKAKQREILEDQDVEGYFLDLSLLQDLEVLEVSLNDVCGDLKTETILVALFHGYEPHVKLDLAVHVFQDGDFKSTNKLVLTVDEFKKALMDAERALGIGHLE